uniref:DUF7876 domain-containing protein n=1 Tax=Ananas comosus var. bracteatus TaxID=296719 RepID=A0A6V7QV36_ANACO
MLTLYASSSLWSLWIDREPKTFVQNFPASITHANVTSGKVACISSESQYVLKLHSELCSKYNFTRLRTTHRSCSPKERRIKNWLLRFHINASSDEDFRSSHNIAISLFRRYRNVIDRGGGDNLKEFITAGVNAYALGCTDEGLRKELMDLKDSGVEIEGLQTYGGGTSVKFKVLSEEVHECILWLSIVFVTILCTPQPTVVRWSSTSPVSSEVLHQWKGFCALIANAYYMRGMAWLPVKTLQLEQMAVMGSVEEPSLVACRMRLVFNTLEVVSPQWPKV